MNMHHLLRRPAAFRAPSLIALMVLLAASTPRPAAAGDWPRFHGPGGSGVAAGDEELPGELDLERHLVWKTPVAKGHSSPVVVGDRVFLTSFDGETLLTLALRASTGELLWQDEAPYERLESIHRIGSRATPSVAADAEYVVSFFGSSGLSCYTPEGELVWRRRMGPFNNQFGAASSPLLAGERVVMIQDHDTGSFLAAFDKRTGEEVWRTERPNFRRNYGSPVLWNAGDKPQVVVAGSAQVTGYDLASGELVWTVRGVSRVVSSTPVVGSDGLLYVVASGGGGGTLYPSFKEVVAQSDGNADGRLARDELPQSVIKNFFDQFDRDGDQALDEEEYESIREILAIARSVALAVKPGGRGDITDSHVLWTQERSIPRNPSPVFYNGHLFLVKEGGIVTSLDARDGRPVKQGRLRGSGNVFSSPVVGDGKLYVASERGKLNVITAEAAWEQLAVVDLAEDVYATPAIAGGRIFVRTTQHVFCFGLK